MARRSNQCSLRYPSRDGFGSLRGLRPPLWGAVSVLASVLVLVVVALAVWKVPEWQLSGARGRVPVRELLELENAYRATVAQAVGGLILAIGVVFTWRQLSHTGRTLLITQEGQITDRFSRAIEQLGAVDDRGNKRLEVRLGGIYALERIARDSPRDYWPIMEILTAYVRQNAPWREGESYADKLADLSAGHRDLHGHGPGPDVQAVLTVLGRRPHADAEREHQRLDLSFTDLRRAELIGANFDRTDFTGACLDQAALLRSRFRHAVFRWTSLRNARLDGADLHHAHLIHAQMDGAVLWGADMRRAVTLGAHLQGAELMGADLRGAEVWDAELRSALLCGADLRGTDLHMARGLGDANLARAKLDRRTKLPEGVRSKAFTQTEDRGMEPMGWKRE